MAIDAFTTSPFNLCSIRSPYYAFVYLNNEITVFDPATNEEFSEMFSGHEFTSMIMTEKHTLIGMANGGFLQIPHNRRGDDIEPYSFRFRSIKEIKSTPLFLFGGNKHLLCVGTGWERSHKFIRCDQVALVWRGNPFFCNVQGLIVAHNFDYERARQLFLTKPEGQTRYQLCIVALDVGDVPVQKEECHSLDRHCTLGYEDWSAHALSKNGDVAFGIDGTFCIVNPTRAQTVSEPLFVENTIGRARGGSACFVGREEEFFVYIAKAGRTSLNLFCAECQEGEWNTCFSVTMDISEIPPNADLRVCSAVKDPGGFGRGLMVKLIWNISAEDSDELEGERQVSTLLRMFDSSESGPLVTGELIT